MSIINRIDSFIKSKKMTRSKFANEVGVQRSNLAHFFNGRNKPSLDFFLKIKRKYPEVDLNWMIYGEKSSLNSTNKADSNEIDSVIIFYKNGTFKKS